METPAEAEDCSESTPADAQPSLFPLFPLSHSSPQCASDASHWLSNTSFTTDLSFVNHAVSSQSAAFKELQDEEDEPIDDASESLRSKPSALYELLESSPSDRDSGDAAAGRRRRESKKKKRRRKGPGDEAAASNDYDFGSRKTSVRSWVASESKPVKDYYFDSRGDRDNLAFGCLYKMDLARYKVYNSKRLSGLHYQGLAWRNKMGSILDRDGDVEALDSKLKSGGRYWSVKYSALERHKNLKRIRITASKKSAVVAPPGDFIQLLNVGSSPDNGDGGSARKISVVEESWEDEVLCKTREFNKMTREQPHDEKVWLSFAEFQDRVASMQQQKGARLQTLEKKISILEKATELNPENEELLICLLKAYQSRDSTDVLIGRWEKILAQNSGNYKLWKEFLHVVQGEFSRFKVSDIRKMYAHAIQALSAACSKQCRQVGRTAESLSLDPELVQLEMGLVEIFLSLCRSEWQAGYQELATALFQAEIEYSLFCPPLILTEQSKQRLFEYFWNGNGARVGEEGALGWSTWLEKEEENRQKIIQDTYSSENEKCGWTGWSEPLSKTKETSANPINVADDEMAVDGSEKEYETDVVKEEEDTETFLKMLGIDVDSEAVDDVKDVSTWIRWSEEESSRDCNQWMPLRAKSAELSHGDGTPDTEVDEQLMRVILFEDVSDYLFSLNSHDARFNLVSQFIDFFGGKISQWTCTNSLSWTEKILSLEAIPNPILEDLRRVHDVLNKTRRNLNCFNLEILLGDSDDLSRRTNMMKFLRNAALLCLTAFPRNHILEEAALVAEELFITRMNSSTCLVTPSRALAKHLLKSDRQDVLLCGVYARREAVFGNIECARKVFDMALSSVEGLTLDLQSIVPLLFFWYAEAELANSSGSSSETMWRVIHILSCLGSGGMYSPYKCQPSSLQLLRAHQGFKERVRMQISAWARGVVEDHSIALICSAALFEELTTGFTAGIEILSRAFSMVLPEKRCQSYQLEVLFNYYVGMLHRHHKQVKLSTILESISQGLQIYPFNSNIFRSLVEICHLYTVPNKLRWMFDDYCHKKPSVVVWLYALSFEMSRDNSQHRIRGLFERALANERLRKSVLLWRSFIAYEVNIACNPPAARRVFFRAIHACPWSKKLWLDGFLKLKSILSAKEMSDLQEVMRDKELNLRTDVYEILLQDEIKSGV